MSHPDPARRSRPTALVTVLVIWLLGAQSAYGASSRPVGGRVTVFPATVAFVVSPTAARVGVGVAAGATITNVGPSTLNSIVVNLRVDPAGLVVNKASQSIAQLKPGKSATVSWSVCGRTVGSYVLLAQVTIGKMAVDSPGRVLTITPNTAKKMCT
jgi:CARDB protein